MDEMNNENFNEDQDYEPETVTLCDEDGNEIELELWDVIDYDGDSYAVMLQPDGDEVIIMVIEELNDEEDSYTPVENEDKLNAVFEIFKERFRDEFDFE